MLRPYQEEAVEAVYRHLRDHDDNPVVVLPTGAGKSWVIAQIAADATRLWSGRVLVLAHRRELLEQNADKMLRLDQELDIGIYSAGLNRREHQKAVVVAGIQSIWKKAAILGAFDLVLIDECHLLGTDEDGMYRKFLADARAIHPPLRLIGLTATPYRLKSGSICSTDGMFHRVCYEISVKDLIQQGFLSPLIAKAGREKADTEGLHIRAGEFITSEVEELMNEERLVESACEDIVEQTRDRNSVLIFACSIVHAKNVVRILNTRHGIECGFVCGETPSEEREQILARFQSAGDDRLKYLVNVDVLTTGFDAPQIDCVALLRPTLSAGLFYQMCLDMDTEVLTNAGWRRCHEVTKGDIVASFDTISEEIVYGPALDKVHRALRAGESMYGVVAPHLDLRVTDQHNMVVRGRAKTCRYWQLQPAVDVANRKDNFTIPVAGHGARFDSEAPLTDDEVRFVGWFLTDGYRNPHNNTVTISQSVRKHCHEVRRVLTGCGFGFREYRLERAGRFRHYENGLNFVIPRGQPRGSSSPGCGWESLAGWIDKDVPELFNTLSRRQFGILLAAMNLANGSSRIPRDYQARTMQISVGCRQRLADRIQQLAIERGYRCNISSYIPKPSEWNITPQRQWMIRIKPQVKACIGGTHKDHSAFGAERCQLKPVDFRSNEWVWCLTTEEGTLVTRRNGKVSIVGNCGRGFRLHLGKKNCLVLDFGGNVLRHGPVDDVRPRTSDRAGSGGAVAKECPKCRMLISAAHTLCPGCGHEFPSKRKPKHDAEASTSGVLTGQVTVNRVAVQSVTYSVHQKKNAPDDAPRTMRVDYKIGFYRHQSEWVCFEHDGYARDKAAFWWRKRSRLPVPTTAREAVELAMAGFLAETQAIRVRSVAGNDFDQIVGYELGPVPETGDDLPPDALDFPFGCNAEEDSQVATEEIPW